MVEAMAAVFAAEVAHRLSSQLDAHAGEFGLSDDVLNDTLGAAAMKAIVRAALSDGRVQAIGRHSSSTAASTTLPAEEIAAMAATPCGSSPRPRSPPHRRAASIATTNWSPRAHPEDGRARLLRHLGAGGVRRHRAWATCAMIVITEELSRASLAAAGSR